MMHPSSSSSNNNELCTDISALINRPEIMPSKWFEPAENFTEVSSGLSVVGNMSSSDSDICDPLLETIKYTLAGIINPALCLFGLVGNLFNVLVLSRRRMKAAMDCSAMERAAHVGLISLAVSDVLYCTSALLKALVSRPQSAFRQEHVILMYAQLYGPYLQNTFMHTGSWLTVIMAAGRYAAICRPLHARYLLGVPSTLLAVAVTFVAWILLQLPIIWTFEVITEINAFENDGGLNYA